MLFIGRGVILGLTGGKNIAFEIKADGDDRISSGLGEINAFGFNNQISLFLVIAAVGAVTLAHTSIGWTTYATGGNEQAARYAGINTRFVRMRSYCPVLALRGDRRADERRAEQGRRPAIRPRRRTRSRSRR